MVRSLPRLVFTTKDRLGGSLLRQRAFPWCTIRPTLATSSHNSLRRNSQTRKTNIPHIPAPTWSIRDDLQLTLKHPPLPPKELERLSRLALIDIVNDKTPQEVAALNQDVANMLHMIQQLVTGYDHDKHEERIRQRTCSSSGGDVNVERDESRIYDVVRDVTAAPLRPEPQEDPLYELDAQQSKETWTNLLQPKMIRKGGGHEYFAITTTTPMLTKENAKGGNKKGL